MAEPWEPSATGAGPGAMRCARSLKPEIDALTPALTAAIHARTHIDLLATG
jgi:hypothetical protein